MSKVHIYYLPTFLADKPPQEGATLLVRKYQKYKSKSGKFVTKYSSEAVYYPSVENMIAHIKAGGYRELPKEAETNPNYIPPRHRSPIHRRVTKL